MKHLIPVILFSSLLGCTGHLDVQSSNDPQGYADSQFVGTWKITGVDSDVAWDWDNNGTTETNILSTWSSCQRDNLYSFSADKTGTFKVSCSNTLGGVWQVVNTEFLVYKPSGLTTESERVVSMTSVEFKSTLASTLPNGSPVTITKTWSRQ